MSESKTPELPEDQLPQEVVAALRQRNGPKINVPELLDRAILADAQKHLGTISRPIPHESKPRRLRWVAWSTGTLATAMLLFALLPGTPDAPRSSVRVSSDAQSMSEASMSVASATTEPFSRDIDGNGQINILDAFALARTMNAGDVDGVRWDQNEDGQLNQADVNLVALVCAQDEQPAAGQGDSVVTQLDGPNDVEQNAVRFEAIDVFVDSGDQPLAAYQFELTSQEPGVEIVGIEGGEHAAFKEPPFYDPKAMNNNRVILAAFNTGQDLPAGRSRVARIHVQVMGPGQREYRTRLLVSATVEGQQIPAKVSIANGKSMISTLCRRAMALYSNTQRNSDRKVNEMKLERMNTQWICAILLAGASVLISGCGGSAPDTADTSGTAPEVQIPGEAVDAGSATEADVAVDETVRQRGGGFGAGADTVEELSSKLREAKTDIPSAPSSNAASAQQSGTQQESRQVVDERVLPLREEQPDALRDDVNVPSMAPLGIQLSSDQPAKADGAKYFQSGGGGRSRQTSGYRRSVEIDGR